MVHPEGPAAVCRAIYRSRLYLSLVCIIASFKLVRPANKISSRWSLRWITPFRFFDRLKLLILCVSGLVEALVIGTTEVESVTICLPWRYKIRRIAT